MVPRGGLPQVEALPKVAQSYEVMEKEFDMPAESAAQQKVADFRQSARSSNCGQRLAQSLP